MYKPKSSFLNRGKKFRFRLSVKMFNDMNEKWSQRITHTLFMGHCIYTPFLIYIWLVVVLSCRCGADTRIVNNDGKTAEDILIMEKPEGWEEMYHWYKKFKPGEIHVLTNIQACTEHYSLSQTEVVSHTLKIQFMKQINQLATILYRRLSLSNLIYIYIWKCLYNLSLNCTANKCNMILKRQLNESIQTACNSLIQHRQHL